MASQRAIYEPVARDAAAMHSVDVGTFLRQITQESNWDPRAGSHAGAQGIAQIVPRFHPGVDPWDPVASLYYAARLMRSHLNAYNGSYALALAAYNAGGGAVKTYGGVPPYEETRRYLTIILGPEWANPSPAEEPPDEPPDDVPPDAPPASVPPIVIDPTVIAPYALAGALLLVSAAVWWKGTRDGI